MSEHIMRQFAMRPTEMTYLACQERQHFHRRDKWCAQRLVRTLWQSVSSGCETVVVVMATGAWEWHVIEARTRLSRGGQGRLTTAAHDDDSRCHCG